MTRRGFLASVIGLLAVGKAAPKRFTDEVMATKLPMFDFQVDPFLLGADVGKHADFSVVSQWVWRDHHGNLYPTTLREDIERISGIPWGGGA